MRDYECVVGRAILPAAAFQAALADHAQVFVPEKSAG
jgi:hypothetical protein